MITPTTVSMIRDIVTIFGVIAGFTYYVITVQNANKTREAQFLLQLTNRFQDKENFKDFHEILNLEFKDYQDFLDNYHYTVDYDAYIQRSTIWFMLDQFGHILKRGIIKAETLYDSMSGAFVGRMWDNHGPIIQELRVRVNNPNHLSGYEYLGVEMNKITTKRLSKL